MHQTQSEVLTSELDVQCWQLYPNRFMLGTGMREVTLFSLTLPFLLPPGGEPALLGHAQCRHRGSDPIRLSFLQLLPAGPSPCTTTCLLCTSLGYCLCPLFLMKNNLLLAFSWRLFSTCMIVLFDQGLSSPLGWKFCENTDRALSNLVRFPCHLGN